MNKCVSENDEPLYLERLIPLGWGIFGWINRWIVIPVFDFLRGYIGSFGVIILILAVLIRLIISPLTYKSYVSMAKMRLVKPEMDAIAAKYPKQEDAMKRQQATMELYKKAGINPMGGCIPMLIQMPIWIAMFNFVPNAIQLRGQSFLWIDDLSTYDPIIEWDTNLWLIGDHLSLTCILFCVANIVYSWFTMQQQKDQMVGQQAEQMKMMQWMQKAETICFAWINRNSPERNV